MEEAGESNGAEQQSSFGIKKIVDCKIGKCGRQMYKVKWEATWEPAENLASVQHLIDEFWTYVDNAKRNEQVALQHHKLLRFQQTVHEAGNILDQNFNKMSSDSKNEVQRLIARTSETSVGISLAAAVSSQFPLQNNLVAYAGNVNTSHITQNVKQPNPSTAFPTTGQQFGSPRQKTKSEDGQENYYPGQDTKYGPIRNKNSAPSTPVKSEEDAKSHGAHDSKVGDSGGKAMSNSGLKYLEHFDNPYVKILLACKVCNKEQSLKYPATWKRHFLTHADKEDLPHKCTFCEKRFVTSDRKSVV